MFDISIEISEKIREKRGRKNITIQQASEEIGISRRTLRDIENGEKKRINKKVYTKIIDWLINS